MMRTFRKGGIHPKAEKLTADKAIITMAMPDEIRLPLQQCIGAPSKCIVRPGDCLVAGQMVAEAGGFVGAPVHTPAAGTVKSIESIRNPQGMWQQAVVITVDKEAAPSSPEPRTDAEVREMSSREIISIVAESGIVGLGGATFPTRVKLTVPLEKKATEVIINGAECEPYLTCDDRLMREHAEEIITGTRLIMRAVGVERGIIGIEANKPEAISAISNAAKAEPGISVVALKKKYPQGSEKQLIEACVKRRVPPGALPIDAGVIVDNVATAYAVYDAVCNRRPLTSRVVTVTGPGLAQPGNFLVPLGTSVSSLIELAGGLPDDTGKIVAGGPMMGRAMSVIDTPVTKGLSGVLVLPDKMAGRHAEGPCIRCGRCVEACPMGLEPYLLTDLALASRWEDAAARGAMACLECGSCSYICPASRPLLDYIKLDRAQIKKMPK